MFKLIKQQSLPLLNVEYFEFEHSILKSRHIHLKADDDNNAFMTGFRTFNNDSTGVAHILEHTVLSGSEKFDIKDPFSAINKRSLNTYLNASTYTNWTCYPFSTQNETDFFNLMEVTSDCAFFPLLRKESFMQEGWRYEFKEPENPNSELTYKGVVLNEMKGYYSNPGFRFISAISQNLYPDTIYAHDFGGNPKNIPDLSYQQFCDFHKKFYHPSNAVFLSYGNIPYQKIQDKIQDLNLSKFDFKEIKHLLNKQPSFKKPLQKTIEYPCKEQDLQAYSYYAKTWHITDVADYKGSKELELFADLIAGNSSCIIPKTLDESNLAINNFCYSRSNGTELMLVIGAEGIKQENIPAFDKLVTQTLEKIAKEGFEKREIEQVLHQFEISKGEKIAQTKNLGLDLLYTALDASVINTDPIKALDQEKDLDQIKQELVENNQFFENYVQKNILNNNHRLDLFFKPSNQLAQKEEADEVAKLENIKNNLNEDEKLQIVQNYKNLEQLQARTDNIDILPKVNVSDIPKHKKHIVAKAVKINNKPYYPFTVATNGLLYITKFSFIKNLKVSDLPYLEIFLNLFNSLGYKNFDYQEAIKNRLDISSGLNINSSLVNYSEDSFYVDLSFSTSFLPKNAEKVKQQMDENILSIRFDEKKNIVRKIKETCNNELKSYFIGNNAFDLAMDLADSQLHNSAIVENYYNGVNYLKTLKHISTNIDNDDFYNQFIEKLQEMYQKVVECYKNVNISLAGSAQDCKKGAEIFVDEHSATTLNKYKLINDYEKFSDTFCLTNSDVNFCCMSLKAPDMKHKLAPALRVLATIISDEFVHINVREKGGAYGGYAAYKPLSRVLRLVSFKDPSIKNTINIYKNLGQWLQDFNFTQQHIDEGILKVIAAIDTPKSKLGECSNALNLMIEDFDLKDLAEYRTNVIKTDLKQVKQAIEQLILPELAKASFAAVVNKNQYVKEGLNFNTFEI